MYRWCCNMHVFVCALGNWVNVYVNVMFIYADFV